MAEYRHVLANRLEHGQEMRYAGMNRTVLAVAHRRNTVEVTLDTGAKVLLHPDEVVWVVI